MAILGGFLGNQMILMSPFFWIPAFVGMTLLIKFYTLAYMR